MNLLVKPFHLTPFEKNINQKANINWDDIIAYVNDLAIGGVAIADVGDGWSDFPVIPTYVSATSIKFSGVDYSGLIQKGDKLYIDQSGNKYFYVTAVSFSTDTTVTVTGGVDYTVANAAIVNPQFSKLASPQGFPLRHTWTPGFTGFSVNPTVTAAQFSISAGMVNVVFIGNADGTSNGTSFTITGFPLTTSPSSVSTDRHFTGIDNGTYYPTVYGLLSGTTLQLQKTFGDNASWTSSGSKNIFGFYLTYPF